VHEAARAAGATMSTQWKLAAATFVGVIALVMAAVAWQTLDTAREASSLVQHSFETRGTSRMMRSRLLTAEAAQRNYVLTGKPEQLQQYRDAKERLRWDLTQLRGQVRDNPSQMNRIDTLSPVIYRAIGELDEGLEALKTSQKDALAVIRDSAAQSTMQAGRQILDEFDTEETTLLVARTARQKGSFMGSLWALGAGAGLAFLVTILVNIAIWRDVAARERAQSDLAETNDALSRSNRDLDQFAYVASHDLKAPLRGISNLATWLEEDLGEVVKDESREHLRLLRGRVQRMDSLIEGILAYSRAGRKKEHPEMVNVRTLLRETIELVSPPDGKAITIDDPMPLITTEKIPFQQIWINLLTNAITHGGNQIHCRAMKEGQNGGWTFSVMDDGPGIAPDYHDRVFEIFQTLAPRDKVEGAGIGLAVVKKLVEGRGGRVWVESAEGSGATFHFQWKDERKGIRFSR
jgi:signal transduction histidine kinase